MISEKVVITNRAGIHSRPAVLFVQTASKFNSNITVFKGEKKGSAKSILNVLALAITKDTEITITAEGEDEEAAVAELVSLVMSKFGEQ